MLEHLVVIDQIFMVRKSAVAVRLLHVIMLDEMRARRFRQMRHSASRSTSRATRSSFPAIPMRGDLAALKPPGSAARPRTISRLKA
jgi:hypothetical protein